MDNQKPDFSYLTIIKHRFFNFLGLYDHSLSFENRLFNLLTFSVVIMLIIGVISNYLIGLPLLLNLLTVFGLVVTLFTFYLSRYRRRYGRIKVAYLLFAFGCLLPAWFLNDGLDGSMIFMFYFLMILAMILLSTKYHVYWLGAITLTVLLLSMLETAFPSWLIHYADAAARRADVLISGLVLLFLTGILMSLFKKTYEKDRRALILSQEKLIQTQKEAESATVAKSKFLSNMSHEIRTPLNGIIGAGELLKRSGLNEEQKGLVTILHNSSELLLNIINDILDISKIEADKLDLQLADCSLDETVRTVMNITSTNLKQGLNLSYHIDKNVNRHVRTDESRLKQVLLNLVGNAIKFTEKGLVDIQVQLAKEGGHEQEVRFMISDTGIGIHPDNLSRLFIPFSQVDQYSARKYGGTGLGLSISKKLVEMMGGTIGATSLEGKGSVFTFTLPLQKAEPTLKMNMTEQPVHRQAPAGLKVLLAEDNKMNQIVFTKMFRTLGQEIEIVDSGKLAVDKAATGDFDIIFMDVQMPEMDGIEATKQIGSHFNGRPDTAPVIIALTADAMKEDRQHCLDAGMSDYMSKPFTIDQLGAMILKWAPKMRYER